MSQAVDIQDIKEILVSVYNFSHERDLVAAKIGDDDLLFDFEGTGADHMDFDSLDALEVAAHLEEKFQIILPSEIEPTSISTPARIRALVTELIGR